MCRERQPDSRHFLRNALRGLVKRRSKAPGCTVFVIRMKICHLDELVEKNVVRVELSLIYMILEGMNLRILSRLLEHFLLVRIDPKPCSCLQLASAGVLQCVTPNFSSSVKM